MAIQFRDTTKNPPTVEGANQGETVLYFPYGSDTPIIVAGDEITIDTTRAHPDIVVFGLDEKPVTIRELLIRGVHEFTIEPEPGATALAYSFGKESGSFEVMRSEIKR